MTRKDKITRKLTKSARAPRGVDQSPSETHKVVISPRPKVTGPKFHAHAHLHLMDSPHAKTDHIDINTLGTGASTRFPRSWSCLQSQRSQGQNSMLMHNYTLWVVHVHKLATLASIPWAQKRPKDSQGQGHSSKVKGHSTKIPCTTTPHG